MKPDKKDSKHQAKKPRIFSAISPSDPRLFTTHLIPVPREENKSYDRKSYDREWAIKLIAEIIFEGTKETVFCNGEDTNISEKL